MRLKATNPVVRQAIVHLEREGKKSKAKIWKDIAMRLDKPASRRTEINLWKIDKLCKDGDVVLVPGKVLGYGDLNHKITIAALSFSQSAVKKIDEAKGKMLTIQELIKSNPKGSKVKILGG